jgi:lipoyl(octanoyl) transferase
VLPPGRDRESGRPAGGAMTAFRLLVTDPADAAHNMAVDEALLLGRLRGTSPPTLRFFAWDPPAVSLGYGQRLDGRIDLEAARRLGVGVVRRLTGGSAILHEGPLLELTYSVVAGHGDFPGAEVLLDTYRWIGAALGAGLRGLGAPVEMVAAQPSNPATMPAFCFARTGSFELEVGGRKLVGSAQRRRGTAFLQHGSVMLGTAPERIRRVFPAEPASLAGMTTVESVLGRRPSFRETAEALAQGFRETHALELRPGDLSADEHALVDSLAGQKYGTDEWTRRGRVAASPVPAAGLG